VPLNTRRKNPGRLSSFFLLLVGCAVTPVDQILGAYIVAISLIIIEHQLLRKR
jgi:hypothetical protein